MPAVTKDELDALWAGWEGQKFNDVAKQTLLNFRDSAYGQYMHAKVDNWAKDPEMSIHEMTGPVWLSGFQMGIARAESLMLETLAELKSPPEEVK